MRLGGHRVACRSGSPAAAQWYEQRRYIIEAIRHPQAARGRHRAGRLLAHNYVDLIFDGRLATGRELNAFPDDVAAADAALAHILAAVRLLAGGREESAGCRESSGLLWVLWQWPRLVGFHGRS